MNLHFSASGFKFLFVVFISLSMVTITNGQIYKPTVQYEIVQSPYYDAFQLYLASRGINAFFYRSLNTINVIDLSSGKTLTSIPSEIFEKNQDSIVQFWFKQTYNPDNSKMIFKWILARNAGIKMTDDDSEFRKAYPSDKKNPNYSTIVFNDIDSAFKARINQMKLAKSLDQNVSNFIQGAPIFSELGGGFAAIFADGISQFIIDRMKEDINTHVISQMKKIFTDHIEFQILFPECWSLLRFNEDFTYSFYMNNMKPAFEKDIKSFLGNVSRLSEQPNYLELCQSEVSLCLMFTMFDLIYGLQNQNNIANIIQKIYSSPYIQKTQFTETNLIKLAGYISFCTREVPFWEVDKENKKWITEDMIHFVLSETEIRNYFVGLIYKNEPGIQFEAFSDSLLSTLNNPNRVEAFLGDCYRVIDQISNTVSNLNTIIKDERDRNIFKKEINLEKYEYYLKLFSQTLDLTQITFEFVQIKDSKLNQTIKYVTQQLKNSYLPAIKTGLTVAENIDQKQYSLAIFNTNILLRMALVTYTDTVLEHKINVEKDPEKRKEIQERQHSLRQFNKYFFTYSSLIASIAMAQNGKEVSEAINAVALPAGSSKIKKTSDWNLALNAYFGVYYRPVQSGDTSIIRKGFTKTYGFTAPVGLGFSRGFKKAGSLSAFLGVIDVGQIVQYRIVNDTIAKTTVAMPEIEWGDIVSPSIQLIYGFPGYIPLSLGVGCQFLPMKIADNKLKFKPYFTLSLTYDIPIINIWNKKK